MQASFRWTDDGVRNGFVTIPDSPFAMPDKCLTAAPAVIPAKAGIQWGIQDISACKQAGMTTQGVVTTLRTGKGRSAYKHPGSAFPGFLGGLFQTPLYHLGRLLQTRLYHLHPCRRTSL